LPAPGSDRSRAREKLRNNSRMSNGKLNPSAG
jgi:hypothetical protein